MAANSSKTEGQVPQEHEEFVTTKEACMILKVSARWLYELRNKGHIRYYQRKRKIWFKKSDLIEFIDDFEMPTFSL